MSLEESKSRRSTRFVQLKALLWKSWIIRRVHFISSIFEVSCPILFIVLVCWALTKTLSNDASNTNTTLGPIIYENSEINIFNNASDFNGAYHIFYAPNTSLAEGIMSAFTKYPNINVYPLVNEKEIDEKLDSATNSTKKDPLYAGIVFENLNRACIRNGQVEYKIKVLTGVGSVQVIIMKFPMKNSQAPMDESDKKIVHLQFYKTFVKFQQYINNEYLKLVCKWNDKTGCESYFKPVDVYRMPYPEYRNPEMPDIGFYDFFGTIILYSYVVFCPLMVKRITDEKSSKARELLRLIGMSDLMYWSSHFLSNFIVILFQMIPITVCLYVFSNPIIRLASAPLVFLALLLFGIQTILFSMTITTVFNKPVIATIVTTIVWIVLNAAIITAWVPTYNPDKTQDPESANLYRRIACLTPSGSIIFFLSQLGEYENNGRGLDFFNLGDASIAYESFTPLNTLLIMILSLPIYCFLIWYLDNVWPFQSGVPKSPFYLILPSYWFPSGGNKMKTADSDPKNSHLHEPVSENQTPIICARNVTKSFSTGLIGKKAAVNKLNLNIYSNQITVLLGHNGAGKSTTMNMITGMFSPTSGSVYVNGFNVATQTKSARQSLSLCPQENIIFTELTVEEHLRLFALLKGSPEIGIDNEIDHVLQLLKLADKKSEKATNLSGGMKRKLSLGIALIGGSNTLILDEPTSGMDPDARRVIWDLLLAIRRERTILITTHYMEEADILADRIAIMNAGELSCSGSPFFLKNALGTGYRLRIDKMSDFNSDIFLKMIQKYISTAKLLSEVETEVVYSLESSMIKNDLMIQFTNLFEEIEKNKAQLRVNASGLSYSTLEDVFLTVGSDVEWNGLNEDTVENEGLELTKANELEEGSTLIFTQLCALLLKRFHYTRRYILMFVFQLIIPGIIILFAVNVQNSLISFVSGRTTATLELSTKGIYGEGSQSFFYGNDTLKLRFESIIEKQEGGDVFPVNESPSIVNIARQILAKVDNDLHDYIRHYLYGIGVEEERYVIWANFEQYHSIPLAFNALFKTNLQDALNIDHFPCSRIINNPTLFPEEKTDNNIITIILPWVFTSLIFLPIAFPFLASSYVMFAIEENASKAKLIQLMTKMSPAIYWIANFIFDLFCHFIAVLVLFAIIFIFDSEGVIFGKNSNNTGVALFVLMFVFGISTIPIAYLLSYRFQKPSSGFVFMVITFFLFGFLLNLFLSIMDLLRNFVGITFMDDWYEYILTVVRVVPIFSFLFGYQKIYKLSTLSKVCSLFSEASLTFLCNDIKEGDIFRGCCEKKCDPCYKDFNPFAMTKFGAGLEVIYMLVGGLVCFLLILFYEVYKVSFLSRLNRMFPSKPAQFPTVNGPDSTEVMQTEDQDVETERARVEQGIQSHYIRDSLTVHRLRKNFGKFNAVADLTFGVKNGECFGLLGVNGAGKTTTFSMLTGDLIPSSGNAFMHEGIYSLVDDFKEFQSRIGYCPQFDALLPLITGEETLYLFARLRGIPKNNIARDVNNLIKMVGLEKHAKKQAGTYSGGNKRKLSIAIALIGMVNGMVLFLDEPSAGVDPAARRKIWQTLGYLKRNFDCSIVLTSHSMEECEALCSRLAIMVNGRFRCLGSTLHLRERYGQGYTVIISLKKDRNDDIQYVDAIQKEIVKYLPSAILKDIHQGLMQFHITDIQEKWSNIFRQMVTFNQQMDFEDYHVSDTTLEQIFLMFARHQKSDMRATSGGH